jgi:hypothetical protein
MGYASLTHPTLLGYAGARKFACRHTRREERADRVSIRIKVDSQ